MGFTSMDLADPDLENPDLPTTYDDSEDDHLASLPSESSRGSSSPNDVQNSLIDTLFDLLRLLDLGVFFILFYLMSATVNF